MLQKFLERDRIGFIQVSVGAEFKIRVSQIFMKEDGDPIRRTQL